MIKVKGYPGTMFIILKKYDRHPDTNRKGIYYHVKENTGKGGFELIVPKSMVYY